MALVLSVRHDQVTLVPDSPDQITSNHGWDVKGNVDFLSRIVDRLQDAGIRSSIFINAEREQVEAAAKTGTDRIELYTEPYAAVYTANREAAIAPFLEAAQRARTCGLGLHAGHDLSLQNLRYFHEQIPWVEEVSIGHQLVCDALYLGIAETIKQYKQCLE